MDVPPLKVGEPMQLLWDMTQGMQPRILHRIVFRHTHETVLFNDFTSTTGENASLHILRSISHKHARDIKVAYQIDND